jgi:ATP-binding cassette subfamily C (CFTR/MRP) protein 1
MVNLRGDLVHRLPYADHIIALNGEGQILEQGSFKKVQLVLDYAQDINHILPPNLKPKEDSEPKIAAPFSEVTLPEDLTEADRRTGDIATYIYYFSTASWLDWFIFALFVCAFTFFQTFPCKSNFHLSNFLL